MLTEEKPYAKCLTCEEKFPDREAMDRHMDQTIGTVDGNRSHTCRVVNPTPEEIAWREIENVIDGATYDACSALERLIERGTVTEEQVRQALKSHDAFSDAWEAYNA